MDNRENILKFLEDKQVFSIDKYSEGFNVSECCDYYYNETLTKDELLQLAEELKELANGE
jgi:hypothetical protein